MSWLADAAARVDTVLVGQEAQPFLVREQTGPAAEDAVRRLPERQRALATLTRAADSPARLAAGLISWVAAVVGAAGLAYALWTSAPLWQRVAAPAAGLALSVLALAAGLQVWRAGRRVVDALCWWTLLPERLPHGGEGVERWRASPVLDAVEARVFLARGWRPVRLLAGAAAFVSPLAFVALALQGGPRYTPTWQDGQGPAVTVFVLLLATAGVVAGTVVLGGLVRANRAQAERDPVQRRLLGRDA